MTQMTRRKRETDMDGECGRAEKQSKTVKAINRRILRKWQREINAIWDEIEALEKLHWELTTLALWKCEERRRFIRQAVRFERMSVSAISPSAAKQRLHKLKPLHAAAAQTRTQHAHG